MFEDNTVTLVRAERRSRRYDHVRGCYVYDISFRSAVPLTERTGKVAEAFGLGLDEREHVLYRDFELRLAEGDVVYIMGDSGSGKSVLLRALRDDLGSEAACLDEVVVDGDSAIVDTLGGSFTEALGLLSRVGLNDAYLFLRRYGELSEGQKYRYRVARLVDGGTRFWLVDEFCSLLDRVTARVVAFNLQRLARRLGVTLVVATAHEDLVEDLGASVLVRKGWGEEVVVEYRDTAGSECCSVLDGVRFRRGGVDDYRLLEEFHYREGGLPVVREVWVAELGGVVAGVVLFAYPAVNSSGRRLAVGYVPGLDELNRDWSVVSRVVVHPRFRGVGLGRRLLAESLRLQGSSHVELVAVMARYNPFAERAGMRRVRLTEPHGSVVAALEALRGLGFNPVLMGSVGYNVGVLGDCDLDAVRGVLSGVSSMYFKRLSRAGRAYVRRAEFLGWLGVQGVESLGRCLSVLHTLGQCKVYLYWSCEW